jgi:tRNA (guanine10-N2)-dimethyltransferase
MKMKYGFMILGDLPQLGEVEVESLLKGFSPDSKILFKDGRLIFAETQPLDSKFFSRLSMVRESFIYLGSVEFENLKEFFKNLRLPGFQNDSICVRVKRLKKDVQNRCARNISSDKLERELGSILWYRGAKIDVKNPDVVIKVYVSERCHIGILNHTTDTAQFLERRPDKKPFFRPGALLPRIGRALVNITGVRDGIILDPMCGTGTILIEAGLMELKTAGVEAYRNIAHGCALNLKYYSLPVNVIRGDAKKLPFKDDAFDGVVTDFPYLQSSKSLGDLSELYENSIDEISRVLKPNRNAVLVSNRDIDEIIEDRLSIEVKIKQRVHRNLTRRFFKCKKLKN